MKTETHILMAVAGVTMVPEVVQAAGEGDASWIALAGACAVFPDVAERLYRASRRAVATVVADPKVMSEEALNNDVARAIGGIDRGIVRVWNQGLPVCMTGAAFSRFRVGFPAEWRPQSEPLLLRVAAMPPSPTKIFHDGGGDASATIKKVEGVVRSWPHHAGWMAALVAGAWLVDAVTAQVIVVSLGLHWLTDRCGMAQWRFWHGDSVFLNRLMMCLSLLLIGWNLIRLTPYLPGRAFWWMLP